MEDFSRRAFVKMSLATFAGVSGGLPMLGCQRTRIDESLNWEQFLDEVELLAVEQDRSTWDEDRYVADAARVIARLDLRDPTLAREFSDYQNRRKNFPEIDEIYKQRLFQISLIEFEPGEVIPHHDHPSMTGVLLCASGELSVQNYDPVSVDDQLVLRQTGDETMRTGAISTLTSRKRNIHRVAANQTFTQVIDIFAPPYNRERSMKSKWFEVDDQPFQGRKGYFAANVR